MVQRISFFVVLISIFFAIFFYFDTDIPLALLPEPDNQAFQNKVVWITGASSGIGASLAKQMSRKGAYVILSARRVEKLMIISEECVTDRVMILPLDVTDSEAQQNAFEAVMAKFGKIDILVLNAGQSQRNLAVETEFAVTEQIMRLNFFSFIELTKLVLPSMLENRSGQIVVMSSLAGIIGTTLGTSYSASKFALHGYFNSLRTEVFQHGIGVSLVCPGPVESEIGEKAFHSSSIARTHEKGKMPTDRCTSLIAKGIYFKIDEMWISEQPILAITYFAQYFPFLSRQLFKYIIGPARITAWKTGGQVYSIKELLKVVFK